MKKTIIAFVFAILATIGQSQAYIIQGECIDNNTLWEYTNITIEGADPLNIDLGTTTCPYGCYTNGSAFGDDCREMPINNSAYGLIIWGICVAFAIGAWRMRGHWGPWTGSVLMLALSLWFAWYVNLAIGLVPFAIAILMTYSSIKLSTKGR